MKNSLFLSIFLIINISYIINKDNNSNDKCKYIILDFYSQYNNENIKNNFYLNNLTNNYIYTKIKIGSNEQLLEMRIDLNTYITYVVNKDLINTNIFTPFNEKTSKSFYNYSISFNSYTNNLYSAFLCKDSIEINNNKINDFNFAYADKLSYYEQIPSGSMGFNYYKDYVIPIENLNFIAQLKDNEIISGQSFTFNFISNYKGQLYLGPDYDKIFPEKYSLTNKQIIKISGGINHIYNRWGLTFNKVKVGEIELDYSKESNFNLGENFILATDEYSEKIYSVFFSKLIEQNKCIKENYSYSQFLFTIKCKKNLNLEKFPSLEFNLNNVDMEPFNLIFDYKSLFETVGEYQYFKIILVFRNDPTIPIMLVWTFGKYFFKEYLMTFNKDAKTITFYNMKNNKGKTIDEIMEINRKNNRIKNLILVVLIIILLILIFLIFLLLRKCLRQKFEIKNRNRKNILVSEMVYYPSDKD